MKQKMVTLRNPETNEEHTIDSAGRARWTAKALAEHGYDGWTVVRHCDGPPVHVPSPEEAEAARLNAMTRAEFMDEVLKRVDERIAAAASR